MDDCRIKEIIINKFNETSGKSNIPLMRSDKIFTATCNNEGVNVSNLGNQSLLTWEVFYKTIELLKQNGGVAFKGDAMYGKLGEKKLPVDSVEGYIAYKVYGKSIGDSVFRRITPICGILSWAGLCKNERGTLNLVKSLF